MMVSMLISVYSSFPPSVSRPFSAVAAPSRPGLQPIDGQSEWINRCFLTLKRYFTPKKTILKSITLHVTLNVWTQLPRWHKVIYKWWFCIILVHLRNNIKLNFLFLTHLWRCPFGNRTCPHGLSFSSVLPSCFHRPDERQLMYQSTLCKVYIHTLLQRTRQCGCFLPLTEGSESQVYRTRSLSWAGRRRPHMQRFQSQWAAPEKSNAAYYHFCFCICKAMLPNKKKDYNISLS